MASTVTTGAIFAALKPTLDAIIVDKTDGVEAAALFTKYFKVSSQEDNFEDDVEFAGGGYASERDEGSEIVLSSITQGSTTRYIARNFGQKMRITEEAQDDNKYDQALDVAPKLKRQMWKTADQDAANMLVRGWDTTYTIGDGLALFSASHTLPGGGTFSNLMSTPMTPSKASVVIARTQVMKYPGHDGLPEGADLKSVVCPVDQWGTWVGLVKSEKDPSAGAFNEINVVNSEMDLKIVPNKFWRNTTTNYAYTTDVMNGLRFKFKKRPKGRTWVDNNTLSILHACTARWARNCSDARGVYGVQS